eukprot:g16427.t1
MWQARSPEGLAAETTGVSSQVPSTSSPSQGLDAWAAWRETHGESAEQADDDGYYDPAWDAGYEEEQWHDDQWLYHSYGGPQQKATSSGWNDTDWEGSGASAAQGWLSDAQLRDFNTASVQRMSAMADGKWAGSFNLAGEYGGYAWSGEGAPQEKQTERLKVPSFDGGGDGDDIGKSARSYVRKVQVWLRCTRMPPRQRALALYDALTDKAWVYAEELDVDMLGSEYGVPYFLEWVQTRFMEVEVSKIAQMMNDLFRRTKRRHDQSVRDFNLEFERMVLRLHEIKCELPPLVKAWLYVDKLRLSEQEEVALLASVGNEYDVKKLQHAALVQDRTLRKGGTVELWRPGASKGRFAGRQQTAHVTQADACSSDEDFGAPHDAASDSSMVVEEGVAMEQHTAFMTYQNAKMKYREAMKGRGTDPEELRRRSEERLKLAKQRSTSKSPTAMPKTATSPVQSPWKMKKAEILKELSETHQVPASSSWTVPELRTMLIESRQSLEPKAQADPMKGITKYSLTESIEQAKAEGIPMPPKPTKGWLIKVLRESRSTPADTIVPFGKFKGWLYREVPRQYLAWAVDEVKAKGESAHPDLARLATWGAAELERIDKVLSPTRNLARDPEALASVPADLDEFEDALDGEDLFDTHGVLFCDSLQWLDAREYEFDYELASEDDGVSGYEDTFEYVSGGLDDFHTSGHAFLTEDTPGNLEYSDDTLLYKDEGGSKTPRERAKEGLRRRRRMNQTSYKKFQQQLFTLSHVFLACTAAVGALAHEIIAEPATDLWRVFQPSHSAWMTNDDDSTVECLELFAGQARISEAFAKKRRGVLEPVDLKYGHDLRDPRCRSSVVSQIRSLRPTMVWMAPPCTVWCGFSNLNYDRQQRRRLRAKEKPFLELIDEVIVEQHRHGGFAVVENPKTSAIWQEPVLQRWVGDANSMLASVDLCRYGMTSEGGHIPLKKSLSLLCTSRTFAEQISKTCDRSHDHQPIQGRETARSAVYPTSFANAVVRAFDKHVCQGRVPTTVFAVDAPAGSDRATPAEEPEEDPEEPAEYGANAVSFKGRVNPTVASLLKRVHQNLGHPPNKELVKHLRIGGAPPAVVQAAEQLKCRTCEKSSKAKVQKISSPVVYLDFNEAIAADILWVDTIDAKNKPCLNIVDLASTYQVVVPLRSTKSEEVAQAFINGWISWAGAPKHLLVDLDSAFKDKFLSMLDQRSITVRCAAGQAHWQNGVAERHGGSWKLIYAKLSEDHLITEEELPEAVAACNDAKNSLRNRSGYSPRQWVFGAQARTVGDLFDGDQELAANHAASADAKFSRSQVIRNGARVAFFRCQTKEALQRAINHRPRVEGRNYDPGELVYYFREVRQGKSKKPTASWCGPAVVIGREGQNYWLARGGRCLLVAPEHLREACHEEVSEMLRLKLAMKEVQDLIKSDDGENYEVIDDGGAPDGQELVPDPEGRVEMEASAEVDDDLAMAANREELIRTSARRAHLLDDVPLNIKRARTAGSAFGPQQVFMAKKCISAKAKEKQLEKELPWGLIPPEERHLYRQAEEKQWAEHIDFGAVKPLTVSESEEVLKTVDPSRILRARFAYKDKNHAKRKVDKNIPCKPKARLCVAGQHDPDLGILDMSVDAPTAGRHSILLAIQLALCRDWSISVGDIRAAFLNGVPAPRQLYFRQPRGGIPSLDPRQLVEVVKGVFGLSTSPKLWWMKLSGDLKEMEFEFESDTIQVVQNPIDPCVFMFRGRSSRATRGLLLTHVDDLMLLAETGLRQVVEKKLLQKFPVDEWQTGDFEYVGSEYKVEDNQVSITQTSYVEGRLSRVTVPTDGNITKEHLEENRTAIGALSWLAKQTRPDLQFTVSQAQKKQNDPSIDDLKEVNKAVDSAIRHKEKGIILRKIDEHTLTFLAYHDAAWGNANDPSLEDPEWMGDHKVSSQIGTVVFMVDEQCLGKKEGRFSLVDWKSRGCHRVCRSTFAGETMACNEAMGDVIYLRGLLLSMVHGEVVSESKAGEKMAVHLVTDCKSLFDHVHREGIPKAPTEKRLAIDLASLRQCLMQEALHQWKKVYGANTPMAPEKPCRPPLHWLPTGAQLADIMTKWMKPDNWWDTLSAGVLHLPLKLQKSNEKETDFTGM